jgi:hypothetical protein
VARYDLGLSWEEFEELTPAMFQALCKRRNIRIKYERYAHAMTASAVYNTSRTSDEQPAIRPFDFVMTEEQAVKKDRALKARQFCRKAMRIPPNTPLEKVLEIRAKAIVDLRNNGYADAEEIFNEVWPTLKPKARG